MSIRDDVKHRAQEGRIRQLVPRVPGKHTRILYVAEAGFADVFGPWEEPGHAKRMQELRADFDHFSSGGLIVVATGRQKTCFMKQLDPLGEEVWTIRSRDPKPAVRVFGRFAWADVFVATNLSYRDYLGDEDSEEWRAERLRSKAEWKKLFPAYEPLSGKTINEYLTSSVVDLRKL